MRSRGADCTTEAVAAIATRVNRIDKDSFVIVLLFLLMVVVVAADFVDVDVQLILRPKKMYENNMNELNQLGRCVKCGHSSNTTPGPILVGSRTEFSLCLKYSQRKSNDP